MNIEEENKYDVGINEHANEKTNSENINVGNDYLKEEK